MSAYTGRAHGERLGRSETDLAFDELVPPQLRHLSEAHWTPIDVAIRVAKLFAPARDARILDIGAGVGKVCSIGALSSPGTWFGVEQHELLTQTAERLARGLGVAHRTRFVHGDAFALDWNEFDALYLYNPFELSLSLDSAGRLDHATDPRDQVTCVEERLATMRAGTRVVTLNGFGGAMPESYELIFQERVPGVDLDLVAWTQRARGRPRVSR